MKLLRTTIASIAFVSAFWIFGQSLALKSHWEAEGNTWVAFHNKEAKRWEALKASIELENKRTTVQTEIRGMVIAELRKCRKNKC